ANVGVQLGEASNLIDVECDTPEAERTLSELFNDDFPVAPTFQSSRGKHRLFAWSDGLPLKAVAKWQGVEFRIGNGDRGAQTVFPPSPGRLWLVDPDDAPLVQLPASVIRIISQTSRDSGPANGHSNGDDIHEGFRNSALATLGGVMRQRGMSPEAILAALLADNRL